MRFVITFALLFSWGIAAEEVHEASSRVPAGPDIHKPSAEKLRRDKFRSEKERKEHERYLLMMDRSKK